MAVVVCGVGVGLGLGVGDFLGLGVGELLVGGVVVVGGWVVVGELSISIIKYDFPEFQLDIRVSSGFYVRSLIHDLGTMLGCGSHMVALERTAVGDFNLTKPPISLFIRSSTLTCPCT